MQSMFKLHPMANNAIKSIFKLHPFLAIQSTPSSSSSTPSLATQSNPSSSSTPSSHVSVKKMQNVISTPPKLLAHWAGEESCCIYRPPPSFLGAHSPSYIPDTISIGPFYHNHPPLQMIEQYKPIYLQALMDRTGLKLEDILNSIQPLETQIRKAYSEKIHIDSSKFIRIMILDGCFIIELLRKACGIVFIVNDPIMSMSYIFQSILKDLIKIQNQVPWFILEKLYKLTDRTGGYPSLHSMALSTFNYSLQRSKASTIQIQPSVKVMHLLDFLRQSFIMDNMFQINSNSTPQYYDLLTFLRQSFMMFPADDYKMREEVTSLGSNDDRFLRFLRELAIEKKQLVQTFLGSFILKNQLKIDINDIDTNSDDSFLIFLQSIITSKQLLMMDYRIDSTVVIQPNVIQSITQLRKVGIVVKPVQLESNNFLDVKFRNGTLEMPPLMIDNFVSCLIFNGVAFEQCHYPSTKHFSTYVTLLDCLVNTSQDVKYLTDQNVIQKYSGKEDEVAELFNNMGKGLMLNLETCYLKDLFKQVNNYQKKSWHTQKAQLFNKYFDSPWSILSVAAAVLLLFLTILETVFTVLGYLYPPC